VLNYVLKAAGVQDQDGLQFGPPTSDRRIIYRNPEALAAQHQPDDPQFPICEAIDLRVRTPVEIHEWTRRDELLSVSRAGGEPERNIGNLFGQNIDCAVNPHNLLIGV